MQSVLRRRSSPTGELIRKEKGKVCYQLIVSKIIVNINSTVLLNLVSADIF
jgi:hypothetical protein